MKYISLTSILVLLLVTIANLGVLTPSFAASSTVGETVSANASPDLPSTTVITVSGNISSNTTWTNGNVYYAVDDVTVLAGVTLTIQPGAIVKFQGSRRLIIDGKLTAAGTAGQPIYFTSYRDDSVGGDTDGTPGSTGGKGDWSWIEFHGSSDPTSLIEYATLRYGGLICCYAARGNIYLQSASPTIRNSTITYSYQDGIYADTSTPTLDCNDIRDNNNLGIRNVTPSTLINATNQYWGSASGPYHATLNPGGQGNGVSDGVNFIPWQTSSCVATSFSLFLPVIIR